MAQVRFAHSVPELCPAQAGLARQIGRRKNGCPKDHQKQHDNRRAGARIDSTIHRRNAYTALLVTCAAPGQCVVMTAGKFSKAVESLARLKMVRKFRILAPRSEGTSWRHEAFCTLNPQAQSNAERLDFILLHADELAPQIARIQEREGD